MAEVETGPQSNRFASIGQPQQGLGAAFPSLGAITTPGPFIALARSLLEGGVVAPLLPLAETMLARWPNNERVRSFHDDVADGAARQGDDALAPDPTRGIPRLRKLLVEARKAEDRPRLMLLSEIAVRAYPGDGWALENILRILNGNDEFDRALQEFDSAPPSARTTCEVMFQAYTAAYRGERAPADAIREMALDVFAGSAHANLWKGRLLRLEKAREEALEAFTLAAQNEPDPDIAIREVASISLALGRIGRYAAYIAKAEPHAPPELAEAIHAARDLLAAAGGSLEAAVAGSEPWASLTSPATAFDIAFCDTGAAPYQPACELMMVGTSLAAGGADRIQSMLFAAYRRALGPDAVKLVLLEFTEGTPSAFYLPQAEIAPQDILIGRAPNASLREIRWLPKPMAVRVQAIYDHIRATMPAVVHATLDMANICAGYAAVLAGVPRIVLHVHNMRPGELAVAGAYNPDYDHCYRTLLSRPEVHLVAVSRATLDDYLDWIDVPLSGQTHVIHNGFDFTEFDTGGAHDAAVALRESLGIAPTAPLIGTAFRFAELKRPDWWVEIAAGLAEKHPEAHFILFGDGDLLEETRALTARLGMEGRIHFPGRVTNLSELIGALDLFMLTSRTEGLPNVLIEAQAAGVPVVSFDVGGARDTFADGVTGRLVAEQSVAAMTEAVSDLLQSPARLGDMGEAARAYAREHFPVARMVDDLAGVLGIGKQDVPVVRFIILMQWGRVGSNLIVNIINQAGAVKMTNERFNQIRDRDGQVAQYRAHFEIDTAVPTRRLIGTKENVMTLADRGEFAGLLRADSVRVIRMRRDDLLKAAVSQMRAEMYAAKTKEELGQALWAVRRGDTPLGPTAIDPGTLLTRMGMMDRARDALMTLFAPDEVFDIEYDDILRDLDGVVAGVRRHLDIPTGAPFRVPFIKATPDDLESVIVNYDEVAAAVRSSPYGALLD